MLRFLTSAFASVMLTAGLMTAAHAQSDGKFSEPDSVTLNQAVFGIMDVNLSGMVTAEELDFYFAFAFISMDLDEDKQVSAEEFRTGYPALMPLPIDMLPDGAARIEQEFQAFDADQNGWLSMAELQARYAPEVAKLDTDGDGRLSEADIADLSLLIFFNAVEQDFIAAEEAGTLLEGAVAPE